MGGSIYDPWFEEPSIPHDEYRKSLLRQPQTPPKSIAEPTFLERVRQLERTYRAPDGRATTLDQRRLNRLYNKASVAPPTPRNVKPHWLNQQVKISVPQLPKIPTPVLNQVAKTLASREVRAISKAVSTVKSSPAKILPAVIKYGGPAYAIYGVYDQAVKTFVGLRELYGDWRDYFASSNKDPNYVPAQVEFSGGQGVGISYQVTVKFNRNGADPCNSIGLANTAVLNAIGPIAGIRARNTGTKIYSNCDSSSQFLLPPSHDQQVAELVSGANGTTKQSIIFFIDLGLGSVAKIDSVTRTDGQPDTGGNPEPVAPGTNDTSFKGIAPPITAPPSTTPNAPAKTNEPKERKIGSPSVTPDKSPSPNSESVIDNAPVIAPEPTISPVEPSYNPFSPTIPPPDLPNDNPGKNFGVPFITPFFPLAPTPSAVKSTPIKKGSGTGADNAPQPKPNPLTQTAVDTCRGGCAEKAASGGGGGGGGGLGTDALNDLLLQNPLLLKIDKTTTDTKAFVTKAWESTKLDKALNLLNTALIVHNAVMLSNSAYYTVTEIIDNILAAFNIKDHEGEDIDTSRLVGNKVRNTIRNIVGAETFDRLSTEFKSKIRVYQAAANLASNVREIVDLSQDITETMGENVSFIGNALKNAGVVRDNAYPHMVTDFKRDSRISRFLEKTQDALDPIENISDDVRDISEEIKDMKSNQKELDEAYAKALKDQEKPINNTKALIEKTPEPLETDSDKFVEPNADK